VGGVAPLLILPKRWLVRSFVCLLNFSTVVNRVTANVQGFVSGVAIAYSLLGTAAELCIVVNVKNCCLALFVELEQMYNNEMMLMLNSSSHTCTKPHVVGSPYSVHLKPVANG
jgi:hypothetical protein